MTAKFGREISRVNDESEYEETNVTEDEEWRMRTWISEERLQEFLMPGLRHAHTLQQLKNVIEYSPPGEYLNNKQK